MEILVPVLLYIILPAIATFISVYLVGRRYLDAYRSSHVGAPDEKLTRADHIRKSFLLLSMMIPPLIYCILLFGMIFSGNGYRPFQEDHILYAGGLMCLSSIFTVAGTGYLYHRSIPELIEDPGITFTGGRSFRPFNSGSGNGKAAKDMRMDQTFMKHLALGIGPHSISVFSLIFSILILLNSNVLGVGPDENTEIVQNNGPEDAELNETRTEDVRTATTIMSASLIPSMVLFLMTPVLVKGSLRDKKVFVKRVFSIFIAQFPILIGLIVSMTIIS